MGFFCLILIVHSVLAEKMINEFSAVFIFALVKYFLFFGLPFLIFWKCLPQKFQAQKIQVIERLKPQIELELKYSLSTLVIQALFFWSLIWLQKNGWLHLYRGFASQGFGPELIAFAAYFVIYDSYFYWSHRLLHWGWLYRKVHVVHHRSLNPTPLASYSFHPIEAVMSLIYFYPVLFLFPASWELLLALIVITDIGNLAGHLGYDFLPKSVWNQSRSSWITTPTHHNMHHQFSRCNYGLYWGGWDYFFKTLHPKTHQEFLRVKDQA